MSDYIDTYIACASRNDLESFARGFKNYIPLQAGRAAVPAGTDSEGNPTPATEAVGDPDLFYTCIRSTREITALVLSPLSIIDATTGSCVVGTFA